MKLLMIDLMKSLINVLIKPSKNFSLLVIKMYEVAEEKNDFISKEIVKKAMNVYGMIISVKCQRILKIISDDVSNEQAIVHADC